MGNLESGLQENTFVFLMIIGILIMLALALAFVIYVNFSQKKILQEKMRHQQLAYEHQEALLHSTILTQEKERKRIARELHDEIGSKLNVIFLNMHRLKKFTDAETEMANITSEVNTLIHTTIDTTRRISHDLLPPTLEEFGLIEAIKELRDSYLRTGSVKIHFELLHHEKKIADQLIELSLFRILQELISNSIKHGRASEIDIKLALQQETIQLAYRDNGQGFDPNFLKAKKGLGMKNIESRLNMIRANHQLWSAPGEGVRMNIDLKMQN